MTVILTRKCSLLSLICFIIGKANIQHFCVFMKRKGWGGGKVEEKLVLVGGFGSSKKGLERWWESLMWGNLQESLGKSTSTWHILLLHDLKYSILMSTFAFCQVLLKPFSPYTLRSPSFNKNENHFLDLLARLVWTCSNCYIGGWVIGTIC